MASKWIYIAAAALAGILLTLEFHLLSLLFVFASIIRVAKENNKRLFIIFSIVMVIFIWAGLQNVENKKTALSSGSFQNLITFTEIPVIDGNRLRAVVTISTQEKIILSHLIQSEEEKVLLDKKLRAGAVCLITGELVSPQINSNENAFNYKEYLNRQNIHWVLETNNFSLDKCKNSSETIQDKLNNLRAKGIGKVKEDFPEVLIPYANALIFGERANFSNETYRAYQQIGVVHLLAISGLHIGLLIAAFYYILLRLGITKELVFWLLLFLLPMYAVISGGNPPVIRAVLMALLLLAGQKWRLPFTTLDAFSISFILFLFYDPFLIYNIGFQLTYCVSLALIISSRKILQAKTTYIKNMFDISIVSTLSSLPVLVFHFYEFSIVGVLANIIYVPFYSVFVLPLMFFLFILQTVYFPLFYIFSEWATIPIEFSERVAQLMASFKYSMIVTGKPSIIILIFMIIGVIMYFLLIEYGKSPFYSVMPLVFILLIQMTAGYFSPRGEVIFIDVGQGDSILIRLPYNRGTYMIDTGGRLLFPEEEWQRRSNPFQVGEDILLPLLKSKRINKINKLILTHSDIDHMGAAHELFGKMIIDEIIISPNSSEKPLMGQLIISAQLNGIPVKEEKAGYGWKNKSGEFQFLFPFDNEYKGNDSSLVLFATFGGLTWLFMGDVETEGEKEMVRNYSTLSADVLKVGHHGSNSSTIEELLTLVQPEYSIISAGRNNRYGHPHPEVLMRLQSIDASILRTDEHGAIHFTFTKKGGTFHTQWQYDKAIKIVE